MCGDLSNHITDDESVFEKKAVMEFDAMLETLKNPDGEPYF